MLKTLTLSVLALGLAPLGECRNDIRQLRQSMDDDIGRVLDQRSYNNNHVERSNSLSAVGRLQSSDGHLSANSGTWTLTATIDQTGINAANSAWAGLGNAGAPLMVRVVRRF